MWRGKYCPGCWAKFSLDANRNTYTHAYTCRNTHANPKRHTNAYADNRHSTNWHIDLN